MEGLEGIAMVLVGARQRAQSLVLHLLASCFRLQALVEAGVHGILAEAGVGTAEAKDARMLALEAGAGARTT
jgi:hypothetical protein